LSLPERRFPPPWTAEETDARFIVRDANGQALAYVYFEEEPGCSVGRQGPELRSFSSRAAAAA
jgi:hypothetical protein